MKKQHGHFRSGENLALNAMKSEGNIKNTEVIEVKIDEKKSKKYLDVI
ncbi:hypothetical protein [Thermovenabulum gondwanense]|nr:hypothetical protein [Thermovenabulum gondwanense]